MLDLEPQFLDRINHGLILYAISSNLKAEVVSTSSSKLRV